MSDVSHAAGSVAFEDLWMSFRLMKRMRNLLRLVTMNLYRDVSATEGLLGFRDHLMLTALELKQLGSPVSHGVIVSALARGLQRHHVYADSARLILTGAAPDLKSAARVVRLGTARDHAPPTVAGPTTTALPAAVSATYPHASSLPPLAPDGYAATLSNIESLEARLTASRHGDLLVCSCCPNRQHM